MIQDGKYIAPTKWEECQREDLNMIPQMQAKGFTVEFSSADKRGGRTVPENAPADAVSFVKGNLHIWKVYKEQDGMMYEWMTSELIDGYYTNHKPIQELKEILK